MNFFRKPPNNTDEFSIHRWFCPYRTTINSAIGRWIVLELSGKYRRKIPSVIPFVIDMINSVHSLPTDLPTTTRIHSFTDVHISSVGDWEYVSKLFTDKLTDGIRPSAYLSSVIPHSVAISVGKTKKPFTDGFTDVLRYWRRWLWHFGVIISELSVRCRRTAVRR